MSTLQTLQVFQALNSSPNARLEHSAELGDGMAAALWSNHHDAASNAFVPCRVHGDDVRGQRRLALDEAR